MDKPFPVRQLRLKTSSSHEAMGQLLEEKKLQEEDPEELLKWVLHNILPLGLSQILFWFAGLCFPSSSKVQLGDHQRP